MLGKVGIAAGTLALCFLLLIAAAAAGVVSLLTGGLLGGGGNGRVAQTGDDYGPVVCTVGGGVHDGGLDLAAQQVANAAVINQVALEDGIAPASRAIVIALAAAFQESGLENLDYGDRDSLGLFQQRSSQGWGNPSQIMNPAYAAQQFYRHLQRVPDWWAVPLWQAAQAVQRSGLPTAYQKWEPEAEIIQQFLAANPNICELSKK